MKLKAYIDQQRGRSIRLGHAIGAPAVLISQWANRKRSIPAERCPEIEKATEGIVTCEDLRPDVDWSYLRGTAKPTQSAK